MSWRTVSLGEVANVGAGNSAPQEDCLFTNGTHNFYRTSDVGRIRTGVIFESSDKLNSEGIRGLKLHPIGTILFPKSGASTFLNHRVMLGKEGYVSSHLATIKARVDMADDKFLLYFLSTIDAKNLVQDSNYPSLKTSVIEKITFSLPPLATQKKIVAKLDAIFAEIDKATSAAETNAKNAEALFKSYLNKFFESRSEGWTEKPLPSLCTLFNGRAYSKNELLDSGKYTVLRVGNFFTNEHWYYSDLELEDNKYCDNGDLLYAWSASFGPRIWYGDKVIYHYHIWKVVPNPAVIDKMFLFYLLEWDVDKIKRDHGTGATMIHVSKKSMESRVLPYVDLDSQKEIVLRLQAMKHHTNSLKRQYDDKLRAIVSYKESILRKAFSGELVKE